MEGQDWMLEILGHVSKGDTEENLALFIANLEASEKECIVGIQSASDQVVDIMGRVEDGLHSVEHRIDHTRKWIRGLHEESTQSPLIYHLHRLHDAHLNIQKAYVTTQEILNWHSRTNLIEQIFETRDIPLIAEKLEEMKVSLAALERLPLYDQRCSELNALQSELDIIITNPFIEAIRKKDVKKLQVLVKALCQIDRISSIRKYYIESRCQTLQKLYDRLNSTEKKDLTNGEEWIPGLCNDVLSSISNERGQAVEVLQVESLPDLHVEIFVKLVYAVIEDIRHKLHAYIRRFLKYHGSEVLVHMHPLVEIWKTFSIDFIRFWDTQHDIHTSRITNQLIIMSFIGPFQLVLDDYSSLEYAILSQKLTSIHECTDISLVSIDIVQFNSILLSTINEAVNRSITLAGGVLSYVLASTLEEFIIDYVTKLSNYLISVLHISGFAEVKVPDSEVRANKKSTAFSLKQAFDVYALVKQFRIDLIDCLNDAYSKCSNSLENVLKFSNELTDVSNVEDVSMLCYVTFLPSQSQKLDKLESFLQQDVMINDISNSLTTLFEVSDSIVYGTLLFDIKAQIYGISKLTCWNASAFRSMIGLPNFSQLPNEQVSNIADLLFNLTQQLEIYFDDVDSIVLWLNNVTERVIDLYIREVRQIEMLSTKGSKQLFVDIDFIIGTLETLGIAIRLSELSIIKHVSGISEEELDKLTKENIDESSIPIFVDVCRMRGVQK